MPTPYSDPDNPLTQGTPTWADVPGANTVMSGVSKGTGWVDDWIARQQQQSLQQGMWTGGSVFQGGRPTGAGLVNAAQQTGNALLMGSVAPEARGLSLERVGEWSGATGSLKHSYLMKDPEGNYVGSVDTTYHPGTKDLRIEDVRADEGAGSLGAQAVLWIRQQLRQLYPDAATLSGRRISGANPEREAAQEFPRQ
jgi:hypothetical protein